MIIILGLVLLIAAVVVGVAGVVTNTGTGHDLGIFSVFDYHVTGSTGALFLYGIIVGAVAMLGLCLLLVGARRTSRRGSEARHGLKQSRRETAAAVSDRDELIDQRDSARAQAAGAQSDTSAAPGTPAPTDDQTGHRARHPFGHRSSPR